MMRDLERYILLRVVDNKWMDHLDAMDQLRTGIGLRAYGQKDPLVEYKFEAYNMFQEMIEGIQEDVVRYLYKVRVVPQEQEQRVKHVAENYGDNAERTPVRVGKKIGRNDPCRVEVVKSIKSAVADRIDLRRWRCSFWKKRPS